MGLATLDAGGAGVVEAALRARTAQHRVVLRHARLNGGNDAGFIADLAFTLLSGGRLLLELHESNALGETSSGALSASR